MSDLLEALAELAARVDAAVHSLHTLEGGGEASESDLPAQVAALSDAFEQKQSQYAVSSEAEQQLETLAALVRVLRELDRFDQFLSAGELVGASVSLRELSTTLDDFAAGRMRTPDPAIQAILQEERIDRQSALHFQLTDVFREAFQFKDGHRLSAPSLQVASRITATPSLVFHDNPISLDDLLLSLDTAGLLDARMSPLAAQLVSVFLESAAQQPQAPLGVIRTKMSAILTTKAADRTTSGGQDSTAGINTLIDRLKVVSAFASNHMFTASFPPPNAFVLRFAQGVFEVITHAVTTAVLGVADDTGVDLTQQALESMQEELESKGLWTAACPSLARFAATLPRRHMAARTNQIVSSITQILETIEGNVVRAPDILQHSLLGQLGLSSAAASVKGAMQGKSGKAQAHLVQHEFATRGFRISQQALLLAEAVSERLDGLASNDKQQEGGSEAAHVLQATKNIVEMFRATVLLDVDGSDVATHSPLRAMTVYCDCIFLSRFLGLLNARIHRVLSRETDSVMFSDLIPLFRRTGETLLLAHLTYARNSLLPDIQTTISASGVQAEQAARKLIGRIQSFARDWERVAPHDVFAPALGVIVEHTLWALFTQMASVGDIPPLRIHSMRYSLSLIKSLENHFHVHDPSSTAERAVSDASE